MMRIPVTECILFKLRDDGIGAGLEKCVLHEVKHGETPGKSMQIPGSHALNPSFGWFNHEVV